MLHRVSLLACAWIAMLGGLSAFAPWAKAADLESCRHLFRTGEYEKCCEAAQAEIDKGVYGEGYYEVLSQAQLQLGRYSDAMQTLQNGLQQYSWSIRLRWLAMQACRNAGQADLRDELVQEVASLVQNSPWRYSDAENLVVLGQFLLDQHADAKQVQEAFFQRARKNNPVHRGPVLALGELALAKRDFALAAEIFEPAVKSSPHDADMLFGLSEAIQGSDPERSAALLNQVLEENPRHEQALLEQANQLTDGESYEEAIAKLDQVLAINSHQPQALALQAVIHELQGNTELAADLREKALSTWAKNPQVDYLIGRELSQKYRFAEGAQSQSRALAMDSAYLPAKKQLAQDLLRLGQEGAGWQLAEEAYKQDQYDIASYNLMALRDELEQFTTLEADGFQVRMDAHEAAVFGDRVLALLQAARAELTHRYQEPLEDVVLVEIFPKPADFAVRTFGMPGVSGYLGVCFGDVITANSPSSQQASPVNWESVLWHEFTHVITLNKTHNRMPRWLSEGISVYEERQRDASWGEQMTPAYRRMILEGEATPVGELSSAFLSPPSAAHLLFAYFECSMVVEYIVDQYGFDALLAILDDLAVGMPINEALARHTTQLEQLEDEFNVYLQQQAESFGNGADFAAIDLSTIPRDGDAAEEIRTWAQDHSRSYPGLKACAQRLHELDQPEDAIEVLEHAIELFPRETGEESALALLAAWQREQGNTDAEEAALRRLIQVDDAASTALLRLIEIATEHGDWGEVRTAALKLLAVRPLIAVPHESLARASEELDRPEEVVQALNAVLEFSPPDLAGTHYRLAVQEHQLGDLEETRQHLLRALEEAPRYRDALALLLQLHEAREAAASPTPEDATNPDAADVSESSVEDDDGSAPTSADETAAPTEDVDSPPSTDKSGE